MFYGFAAAGKSTSDKLTASWLHKILFIVTQKAPLANQFPNTKTFYLELFKGIIS